MDYYNLKWPVSIALGPSVRHAATLDKRQALVTYIYATVSIFDVSSTYWNIHHTSGRGAIFFCLANVRRLSAFRHVAVSTGCRRPAVRQSERIAMYLGFAARMAPFLVGRITFLV